MTRLAFRPFSLMAGVLAAMLARELFQLLWRLADRDPPPSPEERDADWRKLVPALALEGAVFSLVRGLTDHGSRHAYEKAVGDWPGDDSTHRS
jgi:hypothetical protein